MTTDAQPRQLSRGLAYAFGAYGIWGSFPLIITFLNFASPFEVVVWRIVFGLNCAALMFAITRSWGSLRDIFANRRRVIWLSVSALMIYINWVVYVIGIASGHVVESALGYFINPLITILLAVLFLGEKLRPLQWVATGLGLIAVIILTFDYGRLPWIALSLALSFGLYGLAKNKVGGQVTPLASYSFETAVLLPVALVQGLLVALIGGGLKISDAGVPGIVVMVAFGFLTAIPLVLFGSAAKHLPLSLVGFMQYLTPTIQFTLALTVFHEEMPPTRWLGFALVWIGLAALSADMVRNQLKKTQATPAN